MQIQFLGGAQTVTGSQHLLTINGSKILLECGLFQGRRRDTYEKNLNFAYDPADIDVMLLSHAHIDHSGNIPNFHKKGFRQKIFATEATVDLCDLMLRDSAYLHEKDAEWVNRIRSSQGKEPIEPLYTIEDAEGALQRFKGVRYHDPVEVAQGVTATWHDAGHILGSAGILLEIEEDSRRLRVGFSGDIGRYEVPILRDPEPLADLDLLIMESTYGDREHVDDADCDDELAGVINEVIDRGGTLIIPAFAVGRTQLLVYKLHRLLEEKRIPRISSYVDSPMACSATEIFRNHPEAFDQETYDHFLNDGDDPFSPPGFACIRDAEDSKKLNLITDPIIIIAASGMMEGGRVLHHLRNRIEDPRTMLLFVGFAAPHTLARRLMDGDKSVKIFGEEYPVKCEVRNMPYFSGHADRHGLLDYVSANSPQRLKKIFLVHGEKDPAMALRKEILGRGFHKVYVPAQGDVFTV
jgi:metallo-beta-lactamase family protein